MSPEELYRIYGKVVLMAGGSCLHWQKSDLEKAVTLCKLLEVDSLSVKVADGAQVWHSPEEYRDWRSYALSQGVGLVPFMYCYTRQDFGASQLEAQANLIRAFSEQNEDAGMVIDMETEFDGKPSEAVAFAALLHNLPGPLVVSTWANPKQHAYTGVVQAFESLSGVLFGPQEYTSYLAGQESQYPAGCVFAPEVDLSSEFGPNNQVAIATQARNRGHLSLWLWSYEVAPQNQSKIKQLVGIMKSEVAPPLPAPPAPPVSAPGLPTTHQVVEGDNLWNLALHYYGDGSKYPAIYHANVGAIGPNPDIVPMGITLTIPKE